MAERIVSINPDCSALCIQSFVARENMAALLARGQAADGAYDMVIDGDAAAAQTPRPCGARADARSVH